MFSKNNKIYKNNYILIIILSSLIIIPYFIGYFIGKNCSKKIFIVKDETNFSEVISNFITYSQYLEDYILFCIFYDIKYGFYIDVGANDPSHLSVTKSFYLRGWYGINIEPLSDKYHSLLQIRNRDINLNIGVGKSEGNATLYLLNTGSTLYKENLNKKTNYTEIKIHTMKNICRKFVPKNEEIQFVKIDVEGGERDVLLGYDFENYRPKVFCIESTKPGTEIPSHELWEEILLNNNYSFAYQYKINRFYIDNRVKNLRQRFFLADIYIKKFEKNI